MSGPEHSSVRREEKLPDAYPISPAERNRWVLERRGPKNTLDPHLPYAYLWEEEFGASGVLEPTSTLFLTNRECPYRCLMCDLWQNTLDARVPVGAIPRQIEHALAQLPPARQIKLYNAGSFFDPQAIPPEDYAAIAELISPFERVIVECHPAFLGERTLAFQKLCRGQLEVAVGLETVHPEALERLNKRITVDSFRRAADFLASHQIALRVFLLLSVPFLSVEEGLEWTLRSLDVAFEAGASVCCVIPTRTGNGAMDLLEAGGIFAKPSLSALETAVEYGLQQKRGRVFADLWDIEKFFRCRCDPARAERMALMNRTQLIPSPVVCSQYEVGIG
jgi:radical SAM enzyme (TIGR01210 family)